MHPLCLVDDAPQVSGREHGPSTVEHPVAVRAHDRQIVDTRTPLQGGIRQRD